MRRVWRNLTDTEGRFVTIRDKATSQSRQLAMAIARANQTKPQTWRIRSRVWWLRLQKYHCDQQAKLSRDYLRRYS